MRIRDETIGEHRDPEFDARRATTKRMLLHSTTPPRTAEAIATHGQRAQQQSSARTGKLGAEAWIRSFARAVMQPECLRPMRSEQEAAEEAERSSNNVEGSAQSCPAPPSSCAAPRRTSFLAETSPTAWWTTSSRTESSPSSRRAGHSVMTDNPDGFRDAVLQFVVGDE